MLRINLSHDEWISLLNDFQTACQGGLYKKINYDTWKHFTKLSLDKDIGIERTPDCITILCPDSYDESFLSNDNSFGEYIADNWDIIYAKTTYNFVKQNAALSHVKVSGTPVTSDTGCVTLAPNGITWVIDNNNEEKENNTMKNIVNFDFGPLSNSQVRISMYGLAVKNTTGTFVSYDANTQTLMDVDVLNFEGKNLLYKMPVAIKDIKIGDIVIHNTKPMFVVGTGEDNKTLKVIDPVTGEKKEILLLRSPFGFDFATKIVNLAAGTFNTAATPDNPFGNAWMWMLMGDDAANTDNLLPFLMMNGNTNIDPMMMYCLMSHDSNNLLPLFMMSQMNQPHVCTCGCHCGDTEAK